MLHSMIKLTLNSFWRMAPSARPGPPLGAMRGAGALTVAAALVSSVKGQTLSTDIPERQARQQCFTTEANIQHPGPHSWRG